MEKPLLNNPTQLPSEAVLKSVLGSAFDAYSSLMTRIAEPEFALVPEWNYYRDGGAWLCKVQFKKKTVFWLSVWDNYFRVVFYFTEKTVDGLLPLPIDSSCFQQIQQVNQIDKFIPLIFVVQTKEQLDDLLVVVEYKKKLK
jgi:hypothetical protein